MSIELSKFLPGFDGRPVFNYNVCKRWYIPFAPAVIFALKENKKAMGSIHYLSNNIGMEEKAVIFMSIDFALSRNKVPDGEERIRGIAEELFKKHPSIAYGDYPILCALIEDFYKNLVLEGNEHDFKTKELYIYGDLLKKCETLLENLWRVNITDSRACTD